MANKNLRQKILDAIYKVKGIKYDLDNKIYDKHLEEVADFNIERFDLENKLKEAKVDKTSSILSCIINVGLSVCCGCCVALFICSLFISSLLETFMCLSVVVMMSSLLVVGFELAAEPKDSIKNLFKNIKKVRKLKKELNSLEFEKSKGLIDMENKRNYIESKLNELKEKLKSLECKDNVKDFVKLGDKTFEEIIVELLALKEKFENLECYDNTKDPVQLIDEVAKEIEQEENLIVKTQKQVEKDKVKTIKVGNQKDEKQISNSESFSNDELGI